MLIDGHHNRTVPRLLPRGSHELGLDGAEHGLEAIGGGESSGPVGQRDRARGCDGGTTKLGGRATVSAAVGGAAGADEILLTQR